DVALRATDLDWTIVRPGRLIDEPATGKVAAGEDVARGDVTRADVAAVVAALVDTGAAVRAQFNLVGGATPVAEAVAAQSATEV
ncbi:MAG: NAD-dependent dehydratase, partial [Myxococcales bacterium]